MFELEYFHEKID